MPVLGYWKMRQLGQPIRLLLNYLQVPFEDVQYQKHAPDYGMDEWLKVKFNLGLAFPNLPYYIDGDVKLSQMHTILRYIGGKYDMLGQTDTERNMANLVMDYNLDVRQGMEGYTYGFTQGMTKEKYFQEFPSKLAQYENYLGDKPWFAGQHITIADFTVYEVFYEHQVIEPTCLNDYPKIREFMKRFQSLPTIKEYMESDRFVLSPVNLPPAIHLY